MAYPCITIGKPKTSRLIAGSLITLWLASACSGIQHKAPEIDDAEQQAALAEIEAYSTTDTTNAISESEAERRLYEVYRSLKPAALEVCRQIGESRVCAWDINYSNLREYNAFATSGNKVVVFHGIIAATDDEGELAFILAHELGHHIANHISESRKRANTGMLITGLGVAAVSHGSIGCTTYACLNAVQNAAQASMQVGGSLGVLMFSVEQEKEADYLAAYILSQAGYDLATSRTMLLKFGARSDEKETGFLNSHPAGPERLASYDKTIEVVKSDPDGLPGRDFRPVGENNGSGSPNDLTEAENESLDENKFNAGNCRIYLPKENICIH